MSVKGLNRLRLTRIENVPMIYGRIGDHSEAPFTKPLPINNIFIHDGRLDFLFGRKVEDLNGATLSFESDDIFGPVHNSTISVDGTFDNFIVVLQVDNDNLRLIIVMEFLANADETIRFKSL